MSSNGNLVNMQQLYEKDLQAYIAHMNEELAAAQSLVNAMDAAQKGISSLEEEMKAMQQQMISYINGFEPVSRLFSTQLRSLEKMYCYSTYKKIGADQGKIDQFNAVIKEKEEALEAIDPNLSGTLVSLNQLIAQSESLLNDDLRDVDLTKMLDQFEKIFDQLCQVIMDKVQIDLAQAGEKEFGLSPNSASAVMQLATVAIRAEFNEQAALESVQNEVITETTDWQSEKSNAEADLKTSHWTDFFTGDGPDVGKDHAIIRAADAMMSLLMSVEELISPMIETVDPGMQEFQIELDALVKKFHQFLDGHGSLLELKDAMIEALSIMVGIVAETSKDAAEFDKEMSKGTQASAQMHLNDSLAEEQVIEDAKKYAAVMGKLMKAVQYIGMALLLLMNPGVGMALMTLLLATLTATGVMDKLQKAMGGGTGAAIGVGVIEGVGTAGGAAAIEAAIEKVFVSAAIEASETEVEETVATVVKTTVEAATKSADGAGKEAAEEVTSSTVKQSVTNAQEKMTASLLKRSIPQMLKTLLTKAGREEFALAMKVAQKEAAENAAAAIQDLANTAAKQGSASVIGESEMSSIAETSANKGVASATGASEKSVAKTSTASTGRAVASKAVKRAAFIFLASAGSTGWSTDLVATMKHKNKNDLSEGWQDAMMIINAILEIIGMIGASGQGSEILSSPGILDKIYLGSSVANDGAGALGSAGEAQANFEQADAVKAISKDQGGLDVMQFVLEQLQKDGNLERKQYANQMAQIGRTNLKLSLHFNDAESAVAQALAVSAV